MNDDLTPLTKSDHWLGWLGDNPEQAVRDAIEHTLQEQIASSTLIWVRLIGEPIFLTGGRKVPNEPDKIIATRAALAVSFELEVHSTGRQDQLAGVFSWVATELDGKPRNQTYFDLDADLGWAEERLKMRIYKLDAPLEAPMPVQKKRKWEFWR